jgi:peptidoglycan L-alanyl-D-glutamate endopeptidase CwlK
MPSDLLRRLNLDYLYPPFLEELLSLLAECRMMGYDYKCYSGFRATDEQRKLYEAYLAGGAKAAPAGLSAHNYGLAVDCARVVGSGKLSWAKEDYGMLLKVLPKHHLVSGASFSDLPHVQWPDYVSARQLLPLKQAYNVSKGTEPERLKAVWKTLKTT